MIARYYRKAWLYGGGTRQQESQQWHGKTVCVRVRERERLRERIEYVAGDLLLWGEGSMCAWRESASVIMHGEHARQPSDRPHGVCLLVHACLCVFTVCLR